MANFTTGREQRGWIKSETTFGETPGSASVDPYVAADAIAMRLGNGQEIPEQIFPDEKINSRTKQAPIAGMRAGTWTLESLLRGSGTNDVVPDLGPILEAALGTQTINGGTSVNYTLARDSEKSISALFDHQTSKNMSVSVRGGIVEELSFTTDPAGITQVSANGPCKQAIKTHRVVASGTFTAADAIIRVDEQFRPVVGAIYTVASQAGEQLLVTAVTQSPSAVTVTRGYGTTSGAAIASGDVLIPFAPSASTLATTQPISGVRGSVTIDSVTYLITGFTCTIKQNYQVDDNVYGNDLIQDFSATGEREITLGIDFRKRRAFADVISKGGEYLQSQNLIIVMGSTAGNRYTITVPQAYFKMPEIAVAEREIVTVSGEFMAAHATQDLELSILHD